MVTLRDDAVTGGEGDAGLARAARPGWRAGWADGQGRFLAAIVVVTAVLAWVAAAVSGLVSGVRLQAVLVVSGAVLTAVSVGLPLWQRRRANAARADATVAARAARAALRVALSDTLDPLVHLLGRLTVARGAAKTQLRGEAISLVVTTLAGLGGEHRARVCFFALDHDPPRLRPERFAGRAGAPTAEFSEETTAGAAALGIAHGGAWLYFPDTAVQPPPCWWDDERAYRSVLIGPVATPDTVVGLISMDAPGPGELDGIDVALVRVLATLLATALIM
ncbi:GAF domain-containing protein [Pseudonocardia sp. C8]|uniref:GAF domain-containing protein n=1 Tax=Pseudonocardia sp. C8 TaxID=2762759 RepID=UPI0016435F69|nr:GAF domain-containing protein [Pseudonocardia sp. C8]MBC3190950.1 GAF domain-containing protein [Pseudonocardia sp. C8]